MRLDTYGHEPEELRTAVRQLMGDGALRSRMHGVSTRLQAQPGTVRAADAIEVVATGALSPALA